MKKLIYPIVFFFCAESFAGNAGYKPAYTVKDLFQSAYFLKNGPGLVPDYNGQPVLYFADHDGVNVFFTKSGPIYKLTQVDESASKEAAKEKELEKERLSKKHKHVDEKDEKVVLPVHISYTQVRWIGGNPNPQIEEIGKNTGTYSFIAGKTEKDIHSVLTTGFQKIVYHDIYPGIDVEYNFPDKGGMKYNLIVHAGADPSRIKMEYDGSKNIKVDHNGNMTIQTGSGDILEHTPVSYTANGKPIVSAYEIQGNMVGFDISPTYDHSATLTIDPWVNVLTMFTEQNLGCDVDYDVPGNLYVYGAGGANALDTAFSDYQKVAKYDITGALQWIFMGSVPSQNWNTTGNVGYNFLSDSKVDRINEKVYVGCAFNYLTGTQVIRLNSAGVYDNFISTPSADFLEVWSFVQNCASGDIVALGGGLTSNLNFTVINPTTGIVTTSNFTGIAYGGAVGGPGSGQDIVSGTEDSAQNLYVVMASGSTNQVNNRLYKVNTTFTGVVWGPAATGYAAFSEAENMPIYDQNQALDGGSSNNFNALAANGSYLYYYDGKHIKAFSLATGTAVGTAVTLTNRVLTEGGIAVDRCNNVYVGSVGQILTYTFNGSTFTAGAPISLGTGFTTDTVLDVRFNSLNNLIYVTGTRFVGTYTASLSTNCTLAIPFTDTVKSIVTSNVPCVLPNAVVIVNPDTALIVNPAFSYIWQDSAGNVLQQAGPGANLTDTFIPPHSGTFTVQIQLSDNCGGSSLLNSILIVGGDSLATSPDTSICVGRSATLRATPCGSGGTYRWEPGGATTSSITVTPATTTTYAVTYTPASGSPITDSIRVSVFTVPTPTVNDVTVCAGSPATLTTSGGGTYSWSPGGATTSSITVSPVSTTTYTVTVTNAGGCSATASGTVTVNPVPTPTVNSTAICGGSSATLTTSGGGTYLWSPGGATTSSITVTPASTTTYTVTVTASGCSATASGTVTVSPPPTVSVSDTSICSGSSATLTAVPSAVGGTYSWAPGGETTQSITVSPTTATTYTVTYTISGCAPATATATISINTPPTPTVNSATVCQGTSATLTASGGVSYVWNTTATTPSITVSPASTTTYTVTATGANGCSATASGTVTVNPTPTPTVNSPSICAGGQAILTATGGVSYVWNTTAVTPSITVSPAATTTYTVTATDANGCTATTTGTVSIITPPTVSVSDTAICAGTSGTLYATPSVTGGSYLWAPGADMTQSVTVSPTTTTTYTVAYTISGCPPAIDSGTVTINPAPDAGPNDTVCLNATAILNAAGTGSWTAAGTNPVTTTITSPNSASTTITGLSVAGIYTYIWSVSGCSATALIVVTAPPAVSTTAINISCINPTGVITATSTGVSPFTYQWSTSGTSDTINTTSAGTQYTVTVTDNNHCTASATGSVSNLIITVGVGGTPTNVSCYGYSDGKIILAVTPAGQYTYAWSGTAQSTDSIYGLSPGTYTVTVTDSNGCSATAGPFTIGSPTQDTLNISPQDTLITLGDTVYLNPTLTGAYPGASYLWIPSTGLNCDTCLNPVLVPIDTNRDVYELVVVYNNNCSVTDSAIITAKPNDLIGIPTAFTPNGDGKNDTFYILATGVKSFKMNIYDRWGGQIFSTTDINAGWDGTYKGKPEPSEAYMYFFTIVYLDSKTVTHEGTFMLLR